MEALPLHPKAVHIPLALSILMPLVTSGVLLAWWRGWFPRQTWLIVVGLQLVLAVTSLAAVRTGEAEEERVEEMVAHDPLEAHEELGELMLIVSGVVSLAAIAAAVIPKVPLAMVCAMLTLLGQLSLTFIGIRVGDAGGALVYRHGAASAYAQPPAEKPDHDSD
jgi:uncharacterized membrane protein